MGMDIQAYWADVKEETLKLQKLRATQQWQPQDDTNCVYLMSVDDRRSGTKAGFLTLVPLTIQHHAGDKIKYLAGKLLVEGSHRLATQEEAEKWEAQQERQRAEAGIARDRKEGGVVRMEAPTFANTDPNAPSELEMLKKRISQLEKESK